ncbi:cytochrome P450 [Xylaria arbuscula]|nr:cytochrome P450 [Xylaria arbuscula]
MGFISEIMLAVLRGVVGLALLCLGFCFLYLCSPQKHETSVEEQLRKHRKIADFSFWNAKTPGERLKIRAKANARLVTAFHLDNSFTTSDVRVHIDFVKKAKHAIHLVGTDDWVKLSAITQKTLDLYLKRFNNDGHRYVALASLVRVVSFSVVLHILFGIDPSDIDLIEAREATKAINRLWIQSKGNLRHLLSYEQKVLDDALKILLPNEFPCDNRNHPLNLIMPAYETLWRVVLLTFVEIAYHNTDSQTAEELQEAVRNLPQCFCKGSDAEMRALAIGKEGLRLYPPTKRIYRAEPDVRHSNIAADVEFWQRNPEIWSDALNFEPARFYYWHDEDAADPSRERLLKSQSYFPFGVGRHMCPAAGGFGDKIITLLVVELVRRFKTAQTGLKIHFGLVDMAVPNYQRVRLGPLPNGRDLMEKWVLELESGGN